MNILITPKEQIYKELTDIDSFLNITMSENAEEAVLRGNDLAVYVARSGKLLADAKYENTCRNSQKCQGYSYGNKRFSKLPLQGRTIFGRLV